MNSSECTIDINSGYKLNYKYNKCRRNQNRNSLTTFDTETTEISYICKPHKQNPYIV